MLDEFERIRGSLRQPNEEVPSSALAALNGAEGAAPADRRGHAPPPPGSQIAQELRRGHRARGRCDILLPGAPRSAPARNDQHRPFPPSVENRPPPRARGHPCTQPAAFRAPSLCPFALHPSAHARGVRICVRTTRWIAASGGYRGSAALTAPFYSPAPLVEPLGSRSVGENFHPPGATRSPRFQPALDARSPSLIPCTQSCKRSRLKKFFSPGRACCSDCLRVRRPPRLPPDPVCPIPPRRLPTGPEKRKKDAPNPQNRRRDESLTSPLTPKRSLTAPTRATEREADHGQAPEESPRARRGDGDDG